MQNILKAFFIGLCLAFCFPIVTFAQTSPPQQKQEVYKAQVTHILDAGDVYVDKNTQTPYQTVEVQFLDGPDKGKQIKIDNGKTSTIRKDQEVSVGDKVVIAKVSTPQGVQYQIADRYRLDWLLGIVIAFFVLVIGLCRLKGLGSIFGLAVSLFVIMAFIIPQILSGQDPLLISILGSLVIITATIYLAHGFSRKTHIALASTYLSLFVTGGLAYLFIYLLQLNGLGSEDAASLRFGATASLNFQGLLLGGIIIGSLGVLDDVTTGLATVVEELKKANPKYTFFHLASSTFRVGTEHITSLVNTLVLAYAGAGLPLFLYLILNPSGQPLWAIVNSELIVEELVRTLAGSIGLILAVPITILLSAGISSYMSAQPQKYVKRNSSSK